MDNNLRMFRVITGEMVLTEVKELNEDGMYELEYPAVVVPIPPEQTGGQPNQIGFGKFLPFSDYGSELLLNSNTVIADSKPNAQLKDAYNNWVSQVRAQDSGIIVPGVGGGGLPPQGTGQAPPDFGKLNT